MSGLLVWRLTWTTREVRWFQVVLDQAAHELVAEMMDAGQRQDARSRIDQWPRSTELTTY